MPSEPDRELDRAALRARGATNVSQPGRLAIFDASGRQVRRLIDAPLATRPHQIAWDGRGDDGRALPNGACFSRLSVGGKAYRQQIVITR
ncbi:MAG: hypothetical protein IT349_05445 [Candidatus Eisenbacteria bacterium]|nr:hypothetical protein [Candidatus Eisenbacteria bacterium]